MTHRHAVNDPHAAHPEPIRRAIGCFPTLHISERESPAVVVGSAARFRAATGRATARAVRFPTFIDFTDFLTGLRGTVEPCPRHIDSTI